jgi:hypothetical protein
LSVQQGGLSVCFSSLYHGTDVLSRRNYCSFNKSEFHLTSVSQATVAINDFGLSLRSYCSSDTSKQRLITSQATAALSVFGHALISHSSTSVSQVTVLIKEPGRVILGMHHQLEEHISLNTVVQREEVGTVYRIATQSAPGSAGCKEEQ